MDQMGLRLIDLAGGNQSINFYFRHMAHKK